MIAKADPFCNIPLEIQEKRRFVLWRQEVVNERPTKPLYQTRKVGQHASVTREDTWDAFSATVETYHRLSDRFAGIGYILDDDEAGVDLDGCLDPDTGELADWARDIVDRCEGYWEISPSGKGLKSIVPGVDFLEKGYENDWGQHEGIAIYRGGSRYFTLTGEVFEGFGTLAKDAKALRDVWEEYFPGKEKLKSTRVEDSRPSLPKVPEGDEAIFNKMLENKKANDLFSGRWDQRYPSQSEADQALCNVLAFWFGKDPQKIDTAFRRSRLYREKWERKDYRNKTIQRAISDVTSTYSPPRGNGQDLPRGKPLITNYLEGDYNKSKKRREWKALTMKVVLRKVLKATGGYPKRLGSTLFIEYGGAVIFLDDERALFGHFKQLARVQWKHGLDDGKGKAKMAAVERAELFSVLSYTVEEYGETTEYPLFPIPAGVYVTQKQLVRGDIVRGLALHTLVSFFHPKEEVDRGLIEAFILTLFWGGPSGKRPLIVVVGPQESGKTSLIELCSLLVGGVFRVNFDSKGFGDSLAKQIVSDPGLRSRVILLDNIDGFMKSRELAELITAKAFDARPSFSKQRRRLNLLVWAATAVSPALDQDLATRSFVLNVGLPGWDPLWQTKVEQHIEKHRGAIIHDCLDRLKGPPPEQQIEHSRFPEWDLEVLGKVESYAEILATRTERIQAINESAESLWRLLRHLKTLWAYPEEGRSAESPMYQSPELRDQKTISCHRMTELWNEANGTRLSARGVTIDLKSHADRGEIPGVEGIDLPWGVIRPKWRVKKGSPWVVHPNIFELDEEPDES